MSKPEFQNMGTISTIDENGKVISSEPLSAVIINSREELEAFFKDFESNQVAKNV